MVISLLQCALLVDFSRLREKICSWVFIPARDHDENR